jgi:hypothetical protein
VKLEHLIVQHLYNTKHVTLQGIGTIHLDPSVTIPQEGDKNTSVPENAFSFEYNLRAAEDDALIDFIVQQTRKIKPLASSDLESYSILAKQFLNIGKPLTIEGIGTILKNQSGVYEFTPGNFTSTKLDEAPKQLKEKTEDSISFENEVPKKNNSRGFLLFIFFLLIASLAALGIYYFAFKGQPVKTDTATEQPLIPADTVATNIDTTAPKPDTSLNTKPVETVVKDSINFKVVLKEYPDEAAINKAYGKLSSYGHKLVIIKADSAKYQLAMPFTSPLSDTAKAKDSLKIFFGGKPYIILP